MNHPFEHQSTLPNSSQPVPQRKRLGLIGLAFGSLLLFCSLFFVHVPSVTAIVLPTPTPVPTQAPPPPPPAQPVIDTSNLSGSLAPNTLYTVRGMAPSSATMYLFSNGKFLADMMAGLDGKWSTKVSFAEGVYTLKASVMDELVHIADSEPVTILVAPANTPTPMVPNLTPAPQP